MNFTLKVWRQSSSTATGEFAEYKLKDISQDMSFLEMLDQLNEILIQENKEPVCFDHDCREGICGSCSITINGTPHGPERGTTACQLHMRSFKDNATITVEPWKAKPFEVIKDLLTDRKSFEKIMQSGGYISVNTGSVQDANAIPISKQASDDAMDAAACIGCGACVAACKNSSATLYVAAKVSHLSQLPQGKIEQSRRVLSMVKKMDEEGFGACSNTLDCEAVCPKQISTDHISVLNREFLRAKLGRTT